MTAGTTGTRSGVIKVSEGRVVNKCWDEMRCIQSKCTRGGWSISVWIGLDVIKVYKGWSISAGTTGRRLGVIRVSVQGMVNKY